MLTVLRLPLIFSFRGLAFVRQKKKEKDQIEGDRRKARDVLIRVRFVEENVISKN